MRVSLKVMSAIFFVTLAAQFSFAAGIGSPEIDTSTGLGSMTFEAAVKLCASKGTRLPTIREWGAVAMRFGAAGFRETAFSSLPSSDPRVLAEEKINKAQGFWPEFDPNSRIVRYAFYFSREGFNNPTGIDWHQRKICDFSADRNGHGGLNSGFYIENAGSISSHSSSYFHECQARCIEP